jgi:hypothetical protein
MPRPTNKAELLKASNDNFNKLLTMIDELSDDVKCATYNNGELNPRDKTISDVLCHLNEWHKLMEGWYNVGMAGQKPAIPMEGYTFQTLPAMNQLLWDRYNGTPLNEALDKINASHLLMMEMINRHTDEELFEKKYYKWTGTTSLGAYFISATSSHYDWGMKCLKSLKKALKG